MTAPTDLERLLSLREVSKTLAVPEDTLRYWRHVGEGPDSFVIGRRRVVYRASAVARYVAECETADAERRSK